LTVKFCFAKIAGMKLFKIIDGAYLGFYQERGGTVFVSGYRTVKERTWVCKMVTEEHLTPDNWVRTRYYIEGHEGLVQKTEPEHEETKTRVIPEHYETKTETIPAHWGTREYWLEPHIEIRYRFVGTEEQRSGRYGWEQVDGEWVFVGTEEQRAGRAGWESYEEEIPGCWEERRIWFPEVTRTYDVLVPEHEEEYTVVVPARTYSEMGWIPIQEAYRWTNLGGKLVTQEHEVCGWEDVEVEQPIYSYYNPEDEYDLIDRERGPVWVIAGPPEGDKLQLRIIESGDIIDVEAKYLGIGTRTDDNKYVLPGKEPEEPKEPEPLTEEEIEKITWGD